MKKIYLFTLILIGFRVNAQVGIGTATPHASSQLEILSTNKGLLIPRLSQSNIPFSPATGLLLYQTDNTPGFYYFNGTAWERIVSNLSSWGLKGNMGISSSNFIGTTDFQPLIFKVNGIQSGFIEPTGNFNFMMGYQAGLNNTGARVTLLGTSAGLNNAGYYTTAIGAYTLSNTNTGNSNTAVGFAALQNNQSGFANTALGINALGSNISGVDNIAIGSNALYNNLASSSNTAIGSWALVNNTGFANTAIGYQALQYNTTGQFNTAMGQDAGPAYGFTNLSNTTAIGYGANTTANNQIRIGNASVTSIGGQVGWTTLSDVRFKKDIEPELHGLDFIMELHPISYHLDINALNQHIYGDHINPVFEAVSFKEAVAKKESILYSGFSAQQVEEAADHIGYNFSGIHKPENERDHYSLDYSSFVVPLVKAVQEQEQLIEELNKSKQVLSLINEQLVKSNKEMMQRLANIEATLKEIQSKVK